MQVINIIKNIFNKKAFKDVSFVYAGSLLNGVSLFAINIILGRILDKDAFGIFSLSILALSTVAEMSDFGLNGGLLRFAPYYIKNNEDNKLKQLVKTIWSWRVWLSVILTIGGIILSPFIAKYIFNRPEITYYLIFSFVGIGGVILLGFVTTFLQAKENFFYNATLQSLKGLLRLILVVGFYLAGVRSIFVFLSVYISIPWILFLFSYKSLPENFRKVEIEKEIKEKMNSELAKFSFWLTIWSLSAILSSRVDQAMLSHLMGLEKVAVYTMAFQFVFLYAIALQAITSVLMPKMNALKTNEEVVLFIKKVWKWILPVSLAAILLVYPSKFMISLVFGAKYLESIPVYLILSYSMLVSFIGIPLSLIITAFNKTQLVAFSGFIQLIVNFTFNLILIPRYGVIGAGITFALGIIFSFLYNSICSIYLLKFKKISVV